MSSVKESPPESEAIDQGSSILVLEIHLPEKFSSNTPSGNLRPYLVDLNVFNWNNTSGKKVALQDKEQKDPENIGLSVTYQLDMQQQYPTW